MVNPTAPVQDDDAEWLRSLIASQRSCGGRIVYEDITRARLERIASRLSPTPETGLVEALKLARPYVEANADRGSRMAAHHRGADVLEIIDAALSNVLPDEV